MIKKNNFLHQTTTQNQGVYSQNRFFSVLLLPWLVVVLVSCKAFYHTAETPPDDILGNVRNGIGGIVTLAPSDPAIADNPGEILRMQGGGSLTSKGGAGEYQYGGDGTRNPFKPGFLLGAAYELTHGLGVRFLYENGLTDITENEFDSFKNRALKLTVTYDIPVNYSRVRRLMSRE